MVVVYNVGKGQDVGSAMVSIGSEINKKEKRGKLRRTGPKALCGDGCACWTSAVLLRTYWLNVLHLFAISMGLLTGCNAACSPQGFYSVSFWSLGLLQALGNVFYSHRCGKNKEG